MQHIQSEYLILESENNKLKTINFDLQEKLSTSNLIEDQTDKIISLETTLQSLRTHFQTIAVDNSCLKDHKTYLEQEIIVMEEKHNQIFNDKSCLENEIKDMTEQILDLKAELSMQESVIQSIHLDSVGLRSQLDLLEIENKE